MKPRRKQIRDGGAIAPAQRRYVEQPGWAVGPGKEEDNLAPELVTELLKLQPLARVPRREDGLNPEATCVFCQFPCGASGVHRRAGVVRGDCEQSDSVLRAGGQRDHDPVIRAEGAMETGGGQDEAGYELAKRSMGQGWARHVGRPDDGVVGGAEAVKQGGDPARVGDGGGELLSQGDMRCVQGNVPNEGKRNRHVGL